MFNRLFSLFVVLLLSSCSATLPSISGELGDNYRLLKRDLEDQIPGLLDQEDIASMVVLVLDDQKTIYASGFGFSDRKGNIPASTNTAYRVGSISKLFTATAIMQLHEQSKLDIDKPLRAYLPEFSIQTAHGLDGITLRRMMTHHSGLPSDYEKGFTSYQANDSILQDLSEEYVAFKPDTVHTYSNLAYGLLGHVIERISGMSYERYLQQHIFEPLGMENAFVGIRNSPVMAKPYEDNQLQVAFEIRDIAAGDITMSAKDLAKFAQSMMQTYSGKPYTKRSNQIITQESLRAMWRSQNDNVQLDGEFKMGLGWMLSYPDEGFENMTDLAWHNGSTIYYNSSLLMNTRDNLAVIVLSNSVEADEEATDEVAKSTLLAAMASKSGYQVTEYKPQSKAIEKFSAIQVEILSGRFLSSYLGDFTIEGDVDDLSTVVDGLPVNLLAMDDGTVGVDLRLFGLIPVGNESTRKLRFKIIRHDEQVLIKAINGPVVAQKVGRSELSEYWLSYVGGYDLVNPDSLHRKMGIGKLEISNADGFLKGELKVKGEADTIFLQPVDTDRAKTIGYGRNSGGSAHFYSNQNGERSIVYSGLRFVKR